MSARADLEERYGAPAPWRRRVLLGAVGVVVLAFGGWLTWATVYHAEPDAQSELVSFDVVDERTVTAVVDVDVAEDVVALCRVRALAEDHTVVGEVAFEATREQGRRYEEQVRTDRLATTIEPLGCTTPSQPRPR